MEAHIEKGSQLTRYHFPPSMRSEETTTETGRKPVF